MKQNKHRDYIDPVCGMKVSRLTAAAELVHKDKTIYFCANVCKEAFESDPEKSIPHHRQHGLKPR